MDGYLLHLFHGEEVATFSTPLNGQGVRGNGCFLKINDVNLVSSTKDKGCHFRVPKSGLVAKVHAGGQHVSHTCCHFIFSGLIICLASQALTETTSIGDDRHPRACVEAGNFLSVPSCLYCRVLRIRPWPETSLALAADGWNAFVSPSQAATSSRAARFIPQTTF